MQNGAGGTYRRLSVSLRLESRSRKALISSADPYAFNSFSFSWARDCTTFTLHDLTDFYVERLTAHRINNHSLAKLKNEIKIKTSRGPLWYFGPYAACVFCVWGGSALFIPFGFCYQKSVFECSPASPRSAPPLMCGKCQMSSIWFIIEKYRSYTISAKILKCKFYGHWKLKRRNWQCRSHDNANLVTSKSRLLVSSDD